jgi:Fe-S-cluster containining protein
LEAIEKSLDIIAEKAMEKEEENDHFLYSLQQYDGAWLDGVVHGINKEVSKDIDCTDCGNCCSKLVINIAQEEITGLALYLDQPVEEVRNKYIEESLAGNCFINAVPCHFFADKKCTIYEGRFTECRDFPHLHKNGFRERFLGTLLHYGSCPIIYNVVEQLKRRLRFIE